MVAASRSARRRRWATATLTALYAATLLMVHAFVVCIGPDGHLAIELAQAEACCDHGNDGVATVDPGSVARTHGDCGCSDSPLLQQATTIRPSGFALTAASMSPLLIPVAVGAALPLPSFFGTDTHHRLRIHPDIVQRSSVVLLI